MAHEGLDRAAARLTGGVRVEVGPFVRVPRAAVRLAQREMRAGGQAIVVLAQQNAQLRQEIVQLNATIRTLEDRIAELEAQLP